MFRLGAIAVAVLGGVSAAPCPKVNTRTKSVNTGGETSVNLVNTMNEDLRLIWVTFDGKEVEAGGLHTGGAEDHNTFVGHVFRARTNDDYLVWEGEVTELNGKLEVTGCDDLPKDRAVKLFAEGRDIEFEGLIDKAPFTCEGPSSQWSCIKKYTKEEVALRDPFKFGFSKGEVTGQRKEHEYVDNSYTAHIPLIPKLSVGFLKMNMTDVMREGLLGFYDEWKDKAKPHESIGGDYSNIHKVGMSKLNLDWFRDVRGMVVGEMQEVLQWWTQRRLKHTSTFGVRIYHRDSMLINHVDRADTHLASAVLQVAQDGVDEGWPLEVMLDDGTTLEVYLQPGEMVLYEGARLFHGRPMRFQGDHFANVFTHFSPTHYTGPGKPWTDPLSSQERGTGPQHSSHSEL